MEEDAGQTKYRHLANILRDRLRSHPQGYKLPSVRALMRRFNLSQSTVLAALRVLEEEDLISRRHGSGIYANPTRRPVTICFCRPQDADFQNDQREKSLRDACAARGWHFVIDRFDALHVDIFADEIVADAFVLLPELITIHSPFLQRLEAGTAPIVVLGRDTSHLQIDFVTGDDGPVILEFVRGLVELGHKRIAYLDCEPPFEEVAKRVECFLEVCRTLGVEYFPVLSTNAQYGFDSTERADEFLRDYLKNHGAAPLPFTALITGSATGSVPAPLAFHDHGIRIPEDVSLCCIGNYPKARYAIPPLSNAECHAPQLAEEALNIVSRRLAGDQSPLLSKAVPYRPIWRASVGPARPTGA